MFLRDFAVLELDSHHPDYNKGPDQHEMLKREDLFMKYFCF